ncbi:hypothetical protein [Streptomyces sp. NBRC 110611]|uniref:hypothetical protein n=1 Tax=Streptomyces sp. NBRC 110611 TaxID=1621259 RepID=UPI000B257908|nr:hypothetical protein [Streptomyces sp. NBRC 110611]
MLFDDLPGGGQGNALAGDGQLEEVRRKARHVLYRIPAPSPSPQAAGGLFDAAEA